MPSVLLVEDDDKLQRMYQFAFSANGFEVVPAPSGGEALVIISDRAGHGLPPFDAIVLDMIMMGMSGVDFLTNFDHKLSPNTKVVAVTNVDNPNVERKARELGAVDYLIKSDFAPQQVVDRVKAAIAPEPASS